MHQLIFDVPPADPDLPTKTKSRTQALLDLIAVIEHRIAIGKATADDLARRERLIHRREELMEQDD